MSSFIVGQVCPTDIPYGTLLWMKKIRYAEQQTPLSNQIIIHIKLVSRIFLQI